MLPPNKAVILQLPIYLAALLQLQDQHPPSHHTHTTPPPRTTAHSSRPFLSTLKRLLHVLLSTHNTLSVRSVFGLLSVRLSSPSRSPTRAFDAPHLTITPRRNTTLVLITCFLSLPPSRTTGTLFGNWRSVDGYGWQHYNGISEYFGLDTGCRRAICMGAKESVHYIGMLFGVTRQWFFPHGEQRRRGDCTGSVVGCLNASFALVTRFLFDGQGFLMAALSDFLVITIPTDFAIAVSMETHSTLRRCPQLLQHHQVSPFRPPWSHTRLFHFPHSDFFTNPHTGHDDVDARPQRDMQPPVPGDCVTCGPPENGACDQPGSRKKGHQIHPCLGVQTTVVPNTDIPGLTAVESGAHLALPQRALQVQPLHTHLSTSTCIDLVAAAHRPALPCRPWEPLKPGCRDRLGCRSALSAHVTLTIAGPTQ